MPRKGFVPKRKVSPDSLFNRDDVHRFINKLLVQGKKAKAEKIFYGALDLIKQKTKKDPLKLWEQALENVKPTLEVRPRRVGGATYQVPVEVNPDRKEALAFRWIIQYARSRSGKSMMEKLAAELMEAASGAGSSVKKKEDTHKMAEANKAFAHYRW
ncbi:MAG: 30S ribosomal protein S7 [Firmicutes bacterium]|jgi:small subunit ribosomal protein S7|nr:30S ribosomal protein S7 [Bacillota bacterium]